MIKFKIEFDKKEIVKMTAKLQKDLDKLPLEAFKFFRAKTPIKTGNARIHTFLDKDTIVGSYPYAERLDNGWSKQAPRGMTQPTEKFIQDYVKNIKG